MNRFNKIILSAAAASASTATGAVDTNQIISISFQGFASNASAIGTIKAQASNDPTPKGYDAQQSGFTPTNWVDIPAATASIAGTATPGLITVPQASYRWMRAVFTDAGAGSATGTLTIEAFGFSV